MAEQRFDYHVTVAPLVWVLVGLAVIEMLAVHLLLALRWQWLAWPLFFMSGWSVWWLVRWIRSFRRLPHRLTGDTLMLHEGSLRSVAVPLSSIEAILTSWSAGGHKAPGTRNLVPIAHPNRMIALAEPIEGRKGAVDRLAIRVDVPAAFDCAMTEAGITVRSGT